MSVISSSSFSERPYAHLKRLYMDTPMQQAQKLVLDKAQSHYLSRVLRMAEGAELIVFNGKDGAFLARLIGLSKMASVVELVSHVAPQPPRANLIYFFAPLKAGRLDYLVQKAVEMGVGILQPVLTDFTQVKKLNSAKMRANMIEAAEQCETLHVPELRSQIHLADLLETWSNTHCDHHLIICNERAKNRNPVQDLAPLRGKKLGVLVGPEGGFSLHEQALFAQSDFVYHVSLGPRILRADTAAVAALSMVQILAGDWYDGPSST